MNVLESCKPRKEVLKGDLDDAVACQVWLHSLARLGFRWLASCSAG